MNTLTCSPRWLAGARALHRDRPIRLDHTRLPLGLGALMQRRSVLTGRAEHLWRWADGDTQWLAVPPAALGVLPYCTSRAQVEQLLGAATKTSAAAAPDGTTGGLRAADERPGPAGVPGPAATNGRRELIQPGGWAPGASARTPFARGAQLAPGGHLPAFPGASHPVAD